jgi:hypothetical protein
MQFFEIKVEKGKKIDHVVQIFPYGFSFLSLPCGFFVKGKFPFYKTFFYEKR